MSIRAYRILAGAAVLMAAAWSAPAHALTMKECSVKYKAAQEGGTLKGMKWAEFRKAACGADSAAAPAAAPATTTATPATPAPMGSAVFPTVVSPKYSTQSPGKARMHTCLDQYRANKASGGNGELKWIQKGGGYYSECTKRLKA